MTDSRQDRPLLGRYLGRRGVERPIALSQALGAGDKLVLCLCASVILWAFGPVTRAQEEKDESPDVTNVAPAASPVGRSPAGNTVSEVAPGPLAERRQILLSIILKAKKEGIGIATYLTAFNALEDSVKAGQTKEQIEPRLESLALSLRTQLETGNVKFEAFRRDLKRNMRTWQIAAESYACDTNGKYPSSPIQMLPYMPGGSGKIGGKPGSRLSNPVSGVREEILFDAGIKTSVDIRAIRAGNLKVRIGKPGQIGYSSVDAGRSYAIVGTDPDGTRAVQGVNSTLVFSNE